MWGGLAWVIIWTLLTLPIFNDTLVERYILGHPIEIATAWLFCMAMAALIIRLLTLAPQWMALKYEPLEAPPAGGQPVEDAPRLLEQLDRLPSLYQDSYFVERLRAAIVHVQRKDSSESLEKHLRHLEEVDLDRMANGYSFVRVLIWAIPSLGFLGTVIGIAAAIGHLQFDGDSVVESLKLVISPLTYAFDTTALSLILSIPVMFGKYAVERVETSLLSEVDRRTEEEMVGRFFQYGTSNDPNVAAVRRMSEQVVRTVEAMAARQAQVLAETLDNSHRHWIEISSTTSRLFDESLQDTLHSTLERHALTISNSSERQVQMLQQGLETQVDALNIAIERQIDLMNRGMQHNLNAIENGIVNRLSTIDDVFTRQVEQLDSLVTRQVETLGTAIQSQAEHLTEGTSDLVQRLRDGLERLAELLVEALQKHGETLTRSEEELAAENRRHLSEVEAALGEAMVVAADRQEKLIRQSERLLSEMQQSLMDAAEATVEQQQHLVKQGEVLLQVVDATGQVQRLEETLSQNLATLGQTHNFEETLLSLSAAIQLLSARMGRESVPTPAFRSNESNSSSHAA